LTAYAGTADPSAQREGVVNFIKSIASKKDVWFVSNEQLLKWVMFSHVFMFMNTKMTDDGP
jgi:hypothetical protein